MTNKKDQKELTEPKEVVVLEEVEVSEELEVVDEIDQASAAEAAALENKTTAIANTREILGKIEEIDSVAVDFIFLCPRDGQVGVLSYTTIQFAAAASAALLDLIGEANAEAVIEHYKKANAKPAPTVH